MTEKVDESRYVKYVWAQGDVVVQETSPAKAWVEEAAARLTVLQNAWDAYPGVKAALSAQCADCANFEGPYRTGYHCQAFPNGIPKAILDGLFDHEMPYPGDHGVRFEEENE